MNDESDLASALGSPVLALVRSDVPEFEDSFQQELADEGPEMGAFQAMSAFAAWLSRRIVASPGDAAVERAFQVVDEVAASDLPMGRELVTEFVEALQDDRAAFALMGSETLRYA